MICTDLVVYLYCFSVFLKGNLRHFPHEGGKGERLQLQLQLLLLARRCCTSKERASTKNPAAGNSCTNSPSVTTTTVTSVRVKVGTKKGATKGVPLKKKCSGLTKKGEPCKRFWRIRTHTSESWWCFQHVNQRDASPAAPSVVGTKKAAMKGVPLKKKCPGLTKKGEPCKRFWRNRAHTHTSESWWCFQHVHQRDTAPSATPAAGVRPPAPRARSGTSA
eukprot:g42011.t1